MVHRFEFNLNLDSVELVDFKLNSVHNFVELNSIKL